MLKSPFCDSCIEWKLTGCWFWRLVERLETAGSIFGIIESCLQSLRSETSANSEAMALEAAFAPRLAGLFLTHRPDPHTLFSRGEVPFRPRGFRRPSVEHGKTYPTIQRRHRRAGWYCGGLT
jgi:hypothetical protein